MNLIKAIQKLETQKTQIDAALSLLRSMNETPKTAEKIKKKLHWTQKPGNRKKMLKNLRKAKRMS
jgi:hypothetical protein